ncbi:MAG: prepilin-type N-terminal cleavage/methylation domain-containing protein [Candidatus Terrybacteria bacterium]|nr:prepilin-type N-terminal cleavage/methylation domain-containing protein [Candidatus Terrybacteria bacterium]
MIRKNKGFTLIELLVVIAIIGILSSVVLASLNNARKKARDARRVADLKQLQLALEMYFDTSRAYPTSLGALVTDGYIPSEPKDPIGATSYSYAYYPTDSPTYYHLGASLEAGGPLLDTDKDCNSSSTTCPGGVAYTNGFSGVDPIYDVTP